MARALSQYLRIYDSSGVTHYRWQSYYANTTVSLNGATWSYIPFVADGYTAGISGDETNINVKAPATSNVMVAFRAALKNGYLIELSTYQFDTIDGNTAPVPSQTLISTLNGQVVGGTSDLTSINLQLGSALSPVGAQMPPRNFSTALIGKGCIL